MCSALRLSSGHFYLSVDNKYVQGVSQTFLVNKEKKRYILSLFERNATAFSGVLLCCIIYRIISFDLYFFLVFCLFVCCKTCFLSWEIQCATVFLSLTKQNFAQKRSKPASGLKSMTSLFVIIFSCTDRNIGCFKMWSIY